MIRAWVDGTHVAGHYQVDCECGTSWTGQGVPLVPAGYSPALPIAEAVAHAKGAHDDAQLALLWTERFSSWLLNYWTRETLRQAVEGREPIGDTSGVARPAPRTADTSARGNCIVALPLDTEAESRVGPSAHLDREA
jgi:hypothetical protein